jgi:hypothetical protein
VGPEACFVSDGAGTAADWGAEEEELAEAAEAVGEVAEVEEEAEADPEFVDAAAGDFLPDVFFSLVFFSTTTGGDAAAEEGVFLPAILAEDLDAIERKKWSSAKLEYKKNALYENRNKRTRTKMLNPPKNKAK